MLICLVLAGCSSQERELSRIAGFDIPASTIIYIDTHGGFHGDGAAYAEVVLPDRFAEQAASVMTERGGWRAFPLSENVAAAIYGDDSHTALFEIDGDIPAPPPITSGYWRFIDRHSESGDPSDDTGLHDRYSYHFTVILYDAETNILYFYLLDT